MTSILSQSIGKYVLSNTMLLGCVLHQLNAAHWLNRPLLQYLSYTAGHSHRRCLCWAM